MWTDDDHKRHNLIQLTGNKSRPAIPSPLQILLTFVLNPFRQGPTGLATRKKQVMFMYRGNRDK